MIKDLSIRKGRFNWLEPQEYQVCVTFYTGKGPIGTVLSLEDAEHLLYWDEDNPVDLLREVLSINKKVYLYSSDREKLETLLEQCVPIENSIEVEWLKKKRARLLEKIKTFQDEVEYIEKRIEYLGGKDY